MKISLLLIVAVAAAVVSSTFAVGIVMQPMAQAQSGGDSSLPIPSASRMFTPDQAEIVQAGSDRLMLDMAHTPKSIVAGEPATFTVNLLSDDGQWLWHSDFKVTVKETNGEEVLTIPNMHGHGSMAQFTYVFPSAGQYEINIISGQQVGSPNYIEPKVVRETQFNVSVVEPTQILPSNNSSAGTQGAEVKVMPINVSSWAFSPNELKVNKGDIVRLIITTEQDEVPLYNGHGFGIEGYNVNAFLVKGTTQVVEFEADKAGEFVFRCTSFCAHPEGDPNVHFNMVGKLIVEE